MHSHVEQRSHFFGVHAHAQVHTQLYIQFLQVGIAGQQLLREIVIDEIEIFLEFVPVGIIDHIGAYVATHTGNTVVDDGFRCIVFNLQVHLLKLRVDGGENVVFAGHIHGAVGQLPRLLLEYLFELLLLLAYYLVLLLLKLDVELYLLFAPLEGLFLTDALGAEYDAPAHKPPDQTQHGYAQECIQAYRPPLHVPRREHPDLYRCLGRCVVDFVDRTDMESVESRTQSCVFLFRQNRRINPLFVVSLEVAGVLHCFMVAVFGVDKRETDRIERIRYSDPTLGEVCGCIKESVVGSRPGDAAYHHF